MDSIIDFIAQKIGYSSEDLDLTAQVISLVFTAIMAIFGPPLAVFWYKKRRYLDQITYSINELHPQEDGTTLLRIRTVEVLPWSDLLPSNWYLNFKILMAIRKCTLDQPFIILSRRDMDVFQPSLISGLSKQFADGILAEIAGLKVEHKDYVVAATFERYGGNATFKLRVMIVCERDLAKFEDLDLAKQVRFETAHHVERLRTLRKMACRRKYELENTKIDDVRTMRVVQGTFRL